MNDESREPSKPEEVGDESNRNDCSDPSLPTGQAPEVSFVAWWDAVLQGDPQAQDEAARMVNRAVEPMLRRCYPSLDANDITASIQRTIFRRIQEDPDSVRVSSFEHFLNQARLRARYKANNAVRKRRPAELPQFVDETGELRTLDPVDHRAGDVAQQSVDRLFIEDLFRWAEQDGKASPILLENYLLGVGADATAQQLEEELGIKTTPDGVRMRWKRMIERIGRAFGVESA